MFETAVFESQLNALPGTFEFQVKDTARTLSFTTGDEVILTIDGTRYFGGYLTQISRTHAFPADDTNPITSYANRTWLLRGVDYNILFDKRVLRNTANYYAQIPNELGTAQDGAVIREALASYIDVPSGFDITTEIDDVRQVNEFDIVPDWAWPQQGEKLRVLFEELSKFEGQIYFIDADKNFHYHAIETTEHRWGFSDQPNYNAITTSPAEFQGAYYGFREVEATEDGSVIVNDALIWGGSAFAGTSGGTVFARTEDATSQSDHGRWQLAEAHFGEQNYGIQAAVTGRANAIVNGPPGMDAYGEQKGLRFPQWNFRFVWFSHDVPELSGSPNHLRPGSIVSIQLNTFGVTKLLPCRSIRITFPENAPDGTSYVQFTGEFGIQISDPFTLWRYLLRRERAIRTSSVVSAVTNDSDAAPYGAFYSGEPSPAPPDGLTTVFTIPFGYISGTSAFYINGLNQRLGTDYTESDPGSGEFTLASAPSASDELWVTARTLQG